MTLLHPATVNKSFSRGYLSANWSGLVLRRVQYLAHHLHWRTILLVILELTGWHMVAKGKYVKNNTVKLTQDLWRNVVLHLTLHSRNRWRCPRLGGSFYTWPDVSANNTNPVMKRMKNMQNKEKKKKDLPQNARRYPEFDGMDCRGRSWFLLNLE